MLEYSKYKVLWNKSYLFVLYSRVDCGVEQQKEQQFQR